MSRIVLGLFSVAVFSSAFLIFIVQPMVGRRILPWFGGGGAVWNACLAFYQLTLFAGYAYAHWLIAYVQTSRQLIIHAALLVAALFVLPVLPDESWKPLHDSPPLTHILSMLAANVGLPLLLLSATGVAICAGCELPICVEFLRSWLVRTLGVRPVARNF